MSQESTTPDLVELVRKQLEALDRRDLDGVMNGVAEDTVLDGRADFFEGRAAIRSFLEDWFRSWEELDFELEEVSDLGGGVVFGVVIQDGRPVGVQDLRPQPALVAVAGELIHLDVYHPADLLGPLRVQADAACRGVAERGRPAGTGAASAAA